MKSLFTSLFGLVLVASLSAQVPSYVPTDGLVGWWPFNGNANDESGNGNDGVVNGAFASLDRFESNNSAYSFNGITSEISITNSFINLGSDFTISCWMSTSDIGKVQQCLFNSINHTGFVVELNNENLPANKLMYGVGPANAFWSLIYAQGMYNQFLNNIWYHVIFVKTGATYSLFVNNVIDGYTDVLASIEYNQNVGIRFGSIGGSEFFKGSLDDIAIYNRALTPEEITQLYSAAEVPAVECTPLAPNLQDGLVGYWPFCGNANDESGNGNDGVVNGAVLVEDRLGNIDGAYGFQTIGASINTTCPPVLSNNPRTISFWLNPQSSLTAVQEIVVLAAGGDGSMGSGFNVVLFYSPNDPNSINLGVDLGAGFIS